MVYAWFAVFLAACGAEVEGDARPDFVSGGHSRPDSTAGCPQDTLVMPRSTQNGARRWSEGAIWGLQDTSGGQSRRKLGKVNLGDLFRNPSETELLIFHVFFIVFQEHT